MRYFNEQLITAHPRQHGEWWGDLCVNREAFHITEEGHAAMRARLGLTNAAAVLPRDAWQDMDAITQRVMRADEGRVWMADLLPLAKPINIGKLVHLTRVASDAGTVVRSLSGQSPITLDKTVYDYHGTPVPIFAAGFGREWREWNTLQSENFDALADDQENITRALAQDNAAYVLDGDSNISVQGYTGDGIRTSSRSKSINLGSASGGANIDLTSCTPTAWEDFVNVTLGKLLDDNFVAKPVNLYVSPEIGRNLDKPYSGASGTKEGSVRDVLLKNRRIAKIAVSFELTGNELFGFVPSAEYIRPLVGMATATYAVPRLMPNANYDFMSWNAMGIQIRADYNGRSGVFYSVVVNA